MRHRSFQTRVGFTLVELLVVISIIGLLVALLLPALSAARRTAVAAGANTTLQGFGRSFFITSDNDSTGKLSTGAFDHLRDGDVRKYGWVADVIKNKVVNPGKALDASNPSKVNEKVADYVGATNATGKSNPKRWKGESGNSMFGNAKGPKDWSTVAAADIPLKAREELWDTGYNTNFATTWHFSRGDMKPGDDGYGNDSTEKGNPDKSDPGKCPNDGEGPLSEDKLMNCRATRETIALVGNSRNGDAADAAVGQTIGTKTGPSASSINDFFGFDGTEALPYIVKDGDFLVESFTDGMTCPFTDTTLGGSSGEFIHEINDIYPVVGARKNGDGLWAGGSAQILFADGHVAKILDVDGYGEQADGWIGPYKTDPAAMATGGSYGINDGAWNKEVRGKIWLKHLGKEGGAGAGGGGDGNEY